MEQLYHPLPSAIFQGAIQDEVGRHPHIPLPQFPDGGLIIDPDIVLTAQKFNLVIDLFYSSTASTNNEYGQARSASIASSVTASAAITGIVTITRGDFSEHYFYPVGTTGGITTYQSAGFGAGTGVTANVTSLSFNGTQFTEYFSDGMQMIYVNQLGSGAKYNLTKVVDASGVAQTYTYGTGVMAGLLSSIVVPGGNIVTLNYIAGTPTSLVSSFQDWTGRLATLQYDANRNLTTLTTPTGCMTGYGYAVAGTRHRSFKRSRVRAGLRPVTSSTALATSPRWWQALQRGRTATRLARFWKPRPMERSPLITLTPRAISQVSIDQRVTRPR